MTEPDPTAYRPSPQTRRKDAQARAARQRCRSSGSWSPGRIALVFIVGFVLAALL